MKLSNKNTINKYIVNRFHSVYYNRIY